MRFVLMGLMVAGGMPAQQMLSGEEALKKFQTKFDRLARAARPQTGVIETTCSIPLLEAKPNKDVDPAMIIQPRSDVRFHIRIVTPPAPPCNAANWKR